jgi:hypothetical protein
VLSGKNITTEPAEKAEQPEEFSWSTFYNKVNAQLNVAKILRRFAQYMVFCSPILRVDKCAYEYTYTSYFIYVSMFSS